MKRKPVLKIGAVGDLHCSAIPLVKESRIEQIKKALTYLKEQKVDIITVAGDLLDKMMDEYAQSFTQMMEEMFATGHKPEILLTVGNHDFWAENVGRLYANTYHQTVAFFKKYTKQPANCHKVVKGYHFISLAPDTDNLTYKNHIPWLKKQLKIAKQQGGGKPIFLLTHGRSLDRDYPREQLAPKYRYDNRFASWELYMALSKYPNVIHMVGHTHMPLVDETAICQKDFTTIDCSCLTNVLAAQAISKTIIPKQTYCLAAGYVIDVYLDKVEINRIRFDDGAVLKYPWIIDLPCNKANFRYTDKRFEKMMTPPKFLDGELSVHEEEKGTVITFPAAIGADDYIESYFIELTDRNGEKISFHCASYFLDGLDNIPDTCYADRLKLPKGHYFVKIQAKYSYSDYFGDIFTGEIDI